MLGLYTQALCGPPAVAPTSGEGVWDGFAQPWETRLALTDLPSGAARSARKAKGEGHVRKAEILAAAERLFVECGYEGATIRKIADEVGVSSTALYMHFRDKSEILSQICEAGFAKLIAVTEAIEEAGGAPEEIFRRKMRAYATFGFENPNAYRLIYLTRPGEAGSTDDVARRVGRGLFERLRQPLIDLHAQGRLNRDPDVAAQMIWAGVHGVVSLMLTKPYFDWAGRDVLLDSMLDALTADLTSE